VKFYTHYDRPDKLEFLEPGGGKRLVETAGYRTAKQQIEDLIMAGERLTAWRKEQFDAQADEPDPELVAVREPGYDMADASEQLAEINAKIAAAKEELKQAQAAEATVETEEAPEPTAQEPEDTQT